MSTHKNMESFKGLMEEYMIDIERMETRWKGKFITADGKIEFGVCNKEKRENWIIVH